jgi:hypothetical protein
VSSLRHAIYIVGFVFGKAEKSFEGLIIHFLKCKRGRTIWELRLLPYLQIKYCKGFLCIVTVEILQLQRIFYLLLCYYLIDQSPFVH